MQVASELDIDLINYLQSMLEVPAGEELAIGVRDKRRNARYLRERILNFLQHFYFK